MSADGTAQVRYVVLVDAGYLIATSGDLLFGTPDRRRFRVDHAIVTALVERAEAALPGSLLRVYWFDAARDRVPTVEHRELASLPNVKVRLGHLNRQGQQKGVDAQIRADLETLAANRAITDAVLVAGDEDMVPAVESAQAYGVRVHLWGVEPPYGRNQAERLVWEADTALQLDRDVLAPYFSATSRAEPAPVAFPGAASPSAPGTAVAEVPAGGVAPAEEPATAATSVPRPSQVFPPRRRPPAPPPPPTVAPVPTSARLGPPRQRMLEVGEGIAHNWLFTRGKDNLADLLPGPILPPVIDHELLVGAESEIGTSLRPYEEARRALRDGFWARLYREFGISVSES